MTVPLYNIYETKSFSRARNKKKTRTGDDECVAREYMLRAAYSIDTNLCARALQPSAVFRLVELVQSGR